MQYSSTSIITKWILLESCPEAPWALSKRTPLHNAGLRLKYYPNTRIHSNLHLSKFQSFILKVTESIDKNIHLYLLNHIHSLVITVNTETWTFHFLTIILNSDIVLLRSSDPTSWKLKSSYSAKLSLEFTPNFTSDLTKCLECIPSSPEAVSLQGAT